MTLCINPQCPRPQNSENILFCQACGSELLLEGRYRVTRQLGAGGFAKTFEVNHSNTLKVLKVLLLDDAKAVSLFQQEAQVLSHLNHPGIPKGDGYFTFCPKNSQAPLHCLVMEKIEGLDLYQYMEQRGSRPIDEKLALLWLTQLANILHEVHQHNFFHRDIKPSNIMLKADGHLAFIDFGTAREVTRTYHLWEKAIAQSMYNFKAISTISYAYAISNTPIMSNIPQVGQPGSDFSTPDQNGNSVTLDDLSTQWVVLYFYPKDDTPGCTTEAKDFTELYQDFSALGAKILGVSPDSGKSHCKFISKYNLLITLLSDPEHILTEAYGAWRLKKFMGKEYMGVARSTFLISPDKIIAYAWPHVKAKGHAQAVLTKLQELAAT